MNGQVRGLFITGLLLLFLGHSSPLYADLIGSSGPTVIGGNNIGLHNDVGFALSVDDDTLPDPLFFAFDERGYDNSDSGQTFIISSNSDDPDFGSIASFFTDGADQFISWEQGLPSGPFGSIARFTSSESSFFGVDPGNDASGHTIDNFELIIHSLTITQDVPGNSTSVSGSYTINIYGTAIPEPGTLFLVLLGCLGVFLARRLKRTQQPDEANKQHIIRQLGSR